LNDPGQDARWMGAALALGMRGLGRTYPNPNVGCVIVGGGVVVGRGWTQPGGRPHAEAMAVKQAGEAARGATAYVTLEPCAAPGRGPACAEVLIEAGVARVVVAVGDPFPAVDGKGLARLEAAGIAVTIGPGAPEAERAMAGFLTRQRLGRPHVTLKLAHSLDGAAAMADGRSQWITGAAARGHVHVERACADAILVGRGTYAADSPRLDVRLPGLEARSPQRVLLSQNADAPEGWGVVRDVADIGALKADRLFVEGGMTTAAAFFAADLVDRLLIYSAPILFGGGRTLPDIGLGNLGDAHGLWTRIDTRRLGSDTLDVYERVRG
jgi:diaminohydroxyphosphoribosylaminopyrimidine deaminase / 5-amino-6-(5-phosphoribosylamino)uracil reductase